MATNAKASRMRRQQRDFDDRRSFQVSMARLGFDSLSLAMSMVLVLACAPSSGASTKDRCPTARDGTVVLRTAKLGVLRRVTNPPPGQFETVTTWTACWRTTGRRTTLLEEPNNDPYGYGSASFFRASGRYVAFLSSGGSHYNDRSDYLYLANARTGRNYLLAQVGYVPPSSPLLGNQLLALRLNDRGFLGWKVLLASGDSAIYAHDSRGNQLLDSTPSKFGPLGLTGNRLTWALNGDRRSAILH